MAPRADPRARRSRARRAPTDQLAWCSCLIAHRATVPRRVDDQRWRTSPVESEAGESSPYYPVYTGVQVPRNWEHKKEFTEKFYKEVRDFCGRTSSNGCISDWIINGDEEQRNQGTMILQLIKYKICGGIKGHCPSGVTSLQAVLAAGAASGFAFGGKDGSLAGGARPKSGRGEVPPCHSFVPETEVLLADGTSKNIEDVQTGGKILATDPETGKTETREVVASIVTRDDQDFTDITIKTAQGGASLVATDTHPFWELGQKKWVDAGDVRPGARLRTPNGDAVEVGAVRHFRKVQRTHDLTINGTHTYYVLAGATPVLVHNSNGPCGSGAGTASEAGISLNDAQRIQNAADKAGQPIIVVGSRANGSANPASDWDYILSGPSRSRHSQQSSLPRGTGDGEGSGRGRDFWQNCNQSRPDYAELDPSKPHVIFEPRSR